MPDGRIEKLRLGNGLWESAKFNSRLQVTEFNLGFGPESGNLWKLQQEYGEIDGSGNLDTSKNTGNIARQTVSFDGLSQPFVSSYKYDSLYRLTEARETQNSVQTWKQNFTYDRYGNRTGHQKYFGSTEFTHTNVTHPTIDANTNRFNGSQGFTFDKNGNLITDPTSGGRSFVFNGDNKQKEVRDSFNNLIAEYFYDGEGKRVKKQTYSSGVLDEVTVFVYSAGKLIAEYSTAPPPQDPTTKWTVTDQLGSPRVLVDSLGQIISRRDFMPFGEEITPDGTHRTTNLKYNFGDNVRQKFTGYQKDEETQLDFAEARMYQNRHGRFTAPDPLLASSSPGNPQTFNRYIYTGNDPINRTDPSGLNWCQQNGGASVNFQEGRKTCESGWSPVNGLYRAAISDFSDVSNNGPAPGGTVIRFNSNGTVSVADPANREDAVGSAQATGTEIQANQTEIVSTNASQLSTSITPRGTQENSEGPLSLGCPYGVICSTETRTIPRLDSSNARPLKSLEGIKGALRVGQMIPGFNIPTTALLIIFEGGGGNGWDVLSEAPNLIPGVSWFRRANQATDVAKAAEPVVEGIYQFVSSNGKVYVGQSSNIAARIKQHLASGKLLPEALGTVNTTQVLGGKTAREIAEQLRINGLGGIKNLRNEPNPIGKARKYLLNGL